MSYFNSNVEHNSEKAMKELQNRRKRDLGLIEAWKSIERFRKKDGSDLRHWPRILRKVRFCQQDTIQR